MKENNQGVPRKIFDVMIGDNYFDVYDIEGKEHEDLNDTCRTWWVYMAPRLPDGMTPPADSDDLKPFSKGINRRVWDIRFKEYNTTKVKWDELNFRYGLECTMLCNGKPVYSFGTHDLSFAMAKAQYLMVILSEHPYNFFEPEKEKGRKILFFNLPATIQPSTSYPWEISIYPDYEAMDQTEWWQKYKERSVRKTGDREDETDEHDDFIEVRELGYIHWGDALSDGYIGWFRK